jgi:hypothetical protein
VVDNNNINGKCILSFYINNNNNNIFNDFDYDYDNISLTIITTMVSLTIYFRSELQ